MPKITLSGELYSHKNSRRIGKKWDGQAVLMKSKKAMAQAEDYAWQLAQYKTKQNWEKPSPLDYPIKLHFKIFRRTRARFDYVNVVQGVLDAMVKAGYLPDDDADHVIPVFDEYGIDKTDPRVEIYY